MPINLLKENIERDGEASPSDSLSDREGAVLQYKSGHYNFHIVYKHKTEHCILSSSIDKFQLLGLCVGGLPCRGRLGGGLIAYQFPRLLQIPGK